MPKTPIDYSHTFIYKICCKDPTITDIYVGHTTNIVKRRYSHTNSCNNISHKDHNSYVYQFIRDNGGWDNWDMIVLIELTCKDKNEALREERKYLEELKATLNKRIPSRTEKELRETITYKSKRSIYNTDHKETIKTQQREYYLNNKEKIDNWNREYRLKKKQEKETIS
jgi:hypothetical protein